MGGLEAQATAQASSGGASPTLQAMYGPVGATEPPREDVISIAPTGLVVIGFRYPGLAPGATILSSLRDFFRNLRRNPVSDEG